jgi:hypothetical protein
MSHRAVTKKVGVRNLQQNAGVQGAGWYLRIREGRDLQSRGGLCGAGAARACLHCCNEFMQLKLGIHRRKPEKEERVHAVAAVILQIQAV